MPPIISKLPSYQTAARRVPAASKEPAYWLPSRNHMRTLRDIQLSAFVQRNADSVVTRSI